MNIENMGFEPILSTSQLSLANKDIQSPTTSMFKQQGLSFSEWMAEEIGIVNEQIHKSEKMVQEIALGETDNIHQVMISLEKAKIQFELIVQVRNRLLEGYQEIMRMQV